MENELVQFVRLIMAYFCAKYQKIWRYLHRLSTCRNFILPIVKKRENANFSKFFFVIGGESTPIRVFPYAEHAGAIGFLI